MIDQRAGGLLLLVAAVAASVYVFFQRAPEASFNDHASGTSKRACDPVTRSLVPVRAHRDPEECAPISISYVISGVLPTWLNGRNDKLGTVQGLWACANQYKAQHPSFVLASFCVVYITLQTFAIPGPIVLSILSGAMYPLWQAQLLVSFCATTGASLCFALSYFLGRGVFQRVFASMLATFKGKIAQNQSNLFYYLLFLRITPLLPNWFVNIASPLVDVPFKHFFFATLLGLVPANFLHISTGATLNSAAGDAGGNNALNFAILFGLQFLALLPTLFKSKLESYEKRAFESAKSKTK